jgi:hydrogenase expression/formation protein HypE
MQLGKPRQDFLRKVVFRSLGTPRPQVMVGPAFGVDNSIVRLDSKRVLVATADPLSYIPPLGPETSAWLSVHLLASDITTSGFSPEYGLFDFNLPPTMKDEQFSRYWTRFEREWKKLGLSIIGGHTGRYPGLDYSIIGGGFVMATGPRHRYLTSAMAKNGDDLVLTKGAAVETTAILSQAFPRKTRRAIGQRLFDKAHGYLAKVTTVEDAIIATSVGVRNRGVSAMHDATEGGVVAGLIELATASGLGAIADLDNIRVSEETRELCKFFRIDPLVSLSEGSLIIASKTFATDKIISKLASKGIPSQVIGKLSSKFKGCKGVTSKGTRILRYPSSDPYWKAYSRGIERKWK